jgi:uncharacterized protein with HEPN domain
MINKSDKTLPVYKDNPELHLKKLYEFKHELKKKYFGKELDLFMDATDEKINEVKDRLKQEEKYNNG